MTMQIVTLSMDMQTKNEHLIGCKHDMFYHQAFEGLRVLDKCSRAK